MNKFEDALRELDPYARRAESSTLDDRAAADLERILNGQWSSKLESHPMTENVVPLRPVATTTRRSWVKWTVAAAAVVALTVGTSVSGVLDVFGRSDAVAVSPPALSVTPTNESKSQVVDSLHRTALATDDARDFDPQQFSLYEIGEVSVDAAPGNIGPVAKTNVTVQNDDHGIKMMTATTEGAFASDGRMIEYRSADGTRIKPGTTKTSPYIGPQFALPTGQTSESLKKYILDFQTQATALVNESDDPAIAEVIGFTLQEWNFNQKQSASLLELIDQDPGIDYSGRVKDRMGRKGVMFSSESPDSYNGTTRHSLIFDATTGKLNAYEEVYLKGKEFPEGSTRKSLTIAAP